MLLPGVVPTSSVSTSLPTTLVSATLGGGGGPAKIRSRCGIFASAPPPIATILFCIANIVRPRVSCRSHRRPQGLRGWCACDYARASILSLHRMLADMYRTASSPRTFVPRSGPSPTVVSPPPATTGCKSHLGLQKAKKHANDAVRARAQVPVLTRTRARSARRRSSMTLSETLLRSPRRKRR